MGLRTVRVPAGMEELFRRAEEVVSRYFGDRIDDASRGTIEIFGERYVLVRAASLSVEFFSLVASLYGDGREREADDFARNILFDLAHAIGRSDARNFHSKMDLRDPIARLSAGPVHFAHSGWAFVDIFPESSPVEGDDYFLVYDHPYSFESDAWLRAGRRARFPVCIMSSGYSSGWCQESFGLNLVASEILCRARGDDVCRFVMASPQRIEDCVARYRSSDPELAKRVEGYQIPDFFARKRMEEELRRHGLELEERVRERTAELERSRDLLRDEVEQRKRAEQQLVQAQKLEALGRLAGGVAHDFNNIVGIITTRAEILRRRLPAGSDLVAELDGIQAAAERAARLTGQLLAFGRGRAFEPRVIDVGRLVVELGDTLLPLIGEDVELSVQVPGEDGGARATAEVDPGQLEQALMNLAVNARDAMPGGGRLEIAVAREELRGPRAVATGSVDPGEWVIVSVRDTGTGMDEATLARVFDPFFSTKPDGKGSGLGLSIVYGVVRQSGGAIAVDTAPDAGTRFDLYLPWAAAAPAPEVARPVGPPPGPRRDPGSGVTILLVEDEQDLRASLRELLEDDGHAVIATGDPLEAIELVEARPDRFDLLLTDVVMPRLNGRDLARRIRARRPGLPVLFMSGWDPQAARLERDAPGVALLTKPFTADELSASIRAALRRDGE